VSGFGRTTMHLAELSEDGLDPEWWRS